MKQSLYILLLLIAVLTSCKDANPLLPSAIGKPYQVVITGNDSRAMDLISQMLSKEVEALPQPEPMFDIVSVKKTSENDAYARNIIEVNIDAINPNKIKYNYNVNAKPQTIAQVSYSSVEQLAKDSSKVAKALTALFNQAEIKAEIAQLRTKNNTTLADSINGMFGISMCVPADMTINKTGKDFAWLSNNSADAMQNICVLRINGDCTERNFANLHDSIMKENLKGETDNMYMQTVSSTLLSSTDKRDGTMTVKGLWQMKGDAMGGPLVAKTINKGNSVIIIEAFIYAPGKKKRNLLRQTEAVLWQTTADYKQK